MKQILGDKNLPPELRKEAGIAMLTAAAQIEREKSVKNFAPMHLKRRYACWLQFE